jgi:hypothetical protein
MIYVQIGERFSRFDGMDEETITTMLTDQNLTFSFISEEQFKQKLAKQEAELKQLLATAHSKE